MQQSFPFSMSPNQFQMPIYVQPPITQRQKIHVSNLPLTVTQHQLQQAFQHYGNIIDIRIIRKTPTGLPLNQSCYAFISFTTIESAERAILDGGFGGWNVKPQIIKQQQPIQQPQINKSSGILKSRSRSRSQEREQSQQQQQQQQQYQQKQVLTNNGVAQMEQCEKIDNPFYVRELFVTGMDKNCDEIRVRAIFQNFGLIERIDMYPQENLINTYIKFFTIDSAIKAHSQADQIQKQFSSSIKIEFSDYLKRHNVLGNNQQNESVNFLSEILYILFPPVQDKQIDLSFLLEICQQQKCFPNKWNFEGKLDHISQQKSLILLQFNGVQHALLMRKYFQKHASSLLGDSKCEVGILAKPMDYQIQNQQKKDPNIFWSGLMLRSKSHKVMVDAICFGSEPPFQISHQIQVNYKANYKDAIRIQQDTFKFILSPSDPLQSELFEEYIKYFSDKNKIGVAQLGNGIVYILPPNNQTNSIHNIQGLQLLALYHEDKKKLNQLF